MVTNQALDNPPLTSSQHWAQRWVRPIGLFGVDLGSANPERLGLIARTSAMAYKDSNKTVPQIARELGVDYLLESSVRKSHEQMRFTAQLIRAQDQTHLWAHSYDHSLTGVLLVQGELARAVPDEIQVGLPSSAAARLSSTRAVQAQAYDDYLKGRFFWNKRTAAAMTTAESYFRSGHRSRPKLCSCLCELNTIRLQTNSQ